MPQTSPMNWMTISLMAMILTNTCSMSFIVKEHKANSMTNNKSKKIKKWTW